MSSLPLSTILTPNLVPSSCSFRQGILWVNLSLMLEWEKATFSTLQENTGLSNMTQNDQNGIYAIQTGLQWTNYASFGHKCVPHEPMEMTPNRFGHFGLCHLDSCFLVALIASAVFNLVHIKFLRFKLCGGVRLEDSLCLVDPRKPWKWYTVYGIWFHMRNSVTYPILRCMLGYTDN